MSIPGAANPLLLRTAVAGGYQISRSLRFNSSDSAYCSRVPSTAGNRKIFTLSLWVKLSGVNASYNTIFAAGGNQFVVRFTSSTSEIYYFDGSVYQLQLITSAVYRDPSAWFHYLLACNTDAATSSDRVKLYINGSQVTSFSTATYPSPGLSFPVNNTVTHYIGTNTAAYLDAYLADCYLIDGQALTPSSFTETDATTGQLIPKAYSGSFGTNGFWLKFSDNSAATATTLGKDYSGNSNNFTPNNLSVTAGAGNDSLVDTPTSYGTDTGAGGEVRGNYCTLNPLDNAGLTLSNGNLDFQNSSAAARNVRSTVALPSSGKYYAECVFTSATASLTYVQFGLLSSTDSLTSNLTFCVEANQAINILARTPSASPELRSSTVVAGDIFQVAVDIDNSKIWFGVNNTWYNSSGGTNGNPATGANATGTLAASTTYFFAIGKYNTAGSQSVNFGQRPFAYTAPSGFKALCDTNLPAPVVAKPSTVMDVVTYTGTGASRSITGLGFSPDFVWIKERGAAGGHNSYDTVRGASIYLASESTNAEGTDTDALTAFNSDGFSLGSGYTVKSANGSGRSYVAWCWDAGTTTSSNGSGSITSQVRANASAGFSVATLTTPSSGNFTVGHGLNIAPSLVICKARNQAFTWIVYHKSAGAGNYLVLNTTAASTASSTVWQNTDPSSTLVYGNASNWGTADYVMYSFAPVAGYSSFGSYVGNGSADGPFVYTGFRPKFVLIKGSSFVSNWNLLDGVRDSYNVADKILRPNLSNAELNSISAGSGFAADFLSNGFKLRASLGDSNSNAETFVWAAFAESPFAYSRAR